MTAPGSGSRVFAGVHCPAARWSYPSIVLHPSTKAKIDNWVNAAPEFRRVESEPLANDAWETKAIEDGQVVYEEVDLDTDEPVLHRLATWCEQHTKVEPRPPVKTGSNAPSPALRTGSKAG